MSTTKCSAKWRKANAECGVRNEIKARRLTSTSSVESRPAGTVSTPALLRKHLREQILHRFPRSFVGVFVVGHSGNAFGVCVGIGETVDRAGVVDHLPIDLGPFESSSKRLDL